MTLLWIVRFVCSSLRVRVLLYWPTLPIIPEFNLQGRAGHPVYKAAIGTSLAYSDLTQAPAAKV